jgi:hypothetical protein
MFYVKIIIVDFTFFSGMLLFLVSLVQGTGLLEFILNGTGIGTDPLKKGTGAGI